MKNANIRWREKLTRSRTWFKQVNSVHDEWQTETKGDMGIAEYVGKTQAKSIKWAGELLDVKCRLEGSYDIGKNWFETHG